MSSFYSDASLVLIPSGYKNQKVYSAVPTDGSGDLSFTRASDATRVASNGLIEKVRTNVLTYSQDFSNANWVEFDVSRTGTQTDPNGGTTASLYTSLTNFANVSANFSTASASPYTLSIYIRGASSGVVSLRVDSGSTAAQNNISYTTSWQRFTYTFTAGSSTSTVVLGGYASFTTGEAIYVAFAQAELGDIATDYIPTTTAAVSVGPVSGLPRLDYYDSTCPKLLLEPQRTNTSPYSEQFTSGWASSAGSPVTANTTISPSGYQDADTIAEIGNGNYLYQAVTTSSGTFTVSVFAKKGSSTNVGIGLVAGGFSAGMSVQFNFDTQTFATPTNHGGFTSISATSQNYGNGWYRLALTGTTATATTYFFVLGSLAGSAYAANVRLWGAQCEAGAYATSYIPTLGASVTRVADAASKTGISSLIGQTEGVVFVDFNNRLLASYPNEYIVQIISGTTQLWLRKESGGGSFTARLIVSGSTIWTFANSIVPINGKNKIAIAYKTGDSAVFLNGAQVSSTNTSAFSGSAFADLNFNFGGTLNPELPLSQALLFTTRLTNAQLAELTA